MKNIIKAQIYQLKRDKLLKIIFLVVLFMQITNIFGYVMGEQNVTADVYLIQNGVYVSLLALLFGMLFTSQVCGSDFVDKTTNYELLSGHKRSEVYFGRTIISVIGGLLGTMLLLLLPLLLFSLIYGFGSEITISQAMIRIALFIFPAFRMICEMIFFVYIFKNSYFAMIISGLIFFVSQNLMMFLKKVDSLFLASTNITGLFSFETYQTYSAVTLEQYYIYNGSLTASYVAGTIVSSIVFGMIFLLLGYVFFQKDDI
ncbi:MAG: hypothetical protein ACI4F4_00360 [Lachnospiraceae bacterium]